MAVKSSKKGTKVKATKSGNSRKNKDIDRLWLNTAKHCHSSITRICGGLLRGQLSAEKSRVLATLINCKIGLFRYELEEKKFTRDVTIMEELQEIKNFLTARWPEQFNFRMVK